MTKIIMADGQELHRMGDLVAVAFTIKTRKIHLPVTETSYNRIPMDATVDVPDYDHPYVIFPDVRTATTGDYFLDDNDMLHGGVNPEELPRLIEELQKAHDYIANKEWAK